jgi:hypothetical protein
MLTKCDRGGTCRCALCIYRYDERCVQCRRKKRLHRDTPSNLKMAGQDEREDLALLFPNSVDDFGTAAGTEYLAPVDDPQRNRPLQNAIQSIPLLAPPPNMPLMVGGTFIAPPPLPSLQPVDKAVHIARLGAFGKTGRRGGETNRLM